ncbi:VOC family protein [Winogradskyella sp.]|uniref:VOC family protein n=1 Tax=Winogradskyella sp. TaxID=1883156 RepID=UPI0025CFB5C1|nr:VOC family protein [Winogradskyella sp.]
MRHITLITIFSLIVLSCANHEKEQAQISEIENLKAERDSLTNILTEHKKMTENQMYRFLTFQDNNAENAMNFYIEIFENSEIIDVKRWQKEAPVEEGKIMQATFSLNGNLFMCSDSPPIHDWDFTPAVSNFIECKSESQQDNLFTKLSENGTITMPLNNYGFSERFGWVIDQYGISWQLNLN